jgi:MFS superfamily sulfate permease-like transporter
MDTLIQYVGKDVFCLQVYRLYNLIPFTWSNIGWHALLRQAPTLLAVCIVCTFGVSMDILAVQAQLPYEIDADREMASVGAANVAAGLFTGGVPSHATQPVKCLPRWS